MRARRIAGRVRSITLSHKRRIASVHIFGDYGEFVEAMQRFGPVGKDLRGRYMYRDNMPKMGNQGTIAIPLKYLSVEVLAHEFCHLCVSAAKKNTEEFAVTMASSMLAETLRQLRRDGFKVPMRNNRR